MKTQIEKWTELKEQYPDTMLVMRMGDFYEVFGVDAANRTATILPEQKVASARATSIHYGNAEQHPRQR